MSKKTELLSKKIMLTLALGACFFAVQNPVMAAEITIGDATVLPAAGASVGGLSAININDTRKYFYVYPTEPGSALVIDTTKDLAAAMPGGTENIMASVFAQTGNANGGSITLKNGTVAYVTGGEAKNGDACNNVVTITGGTAKEDVGGGFTAKGNVKENVVRISGAANLQAFVTGGYTLSGDATSNKLIISGGTFGSRLLDLNGGQAHGESYAGYSESGSAYYNEVEISGDSTFFHGGVAGGSALRSGEAKYNKLTMSGGTVTTSIGGAAANDDAIGNEVIFSGGLVNGLDYDGNKNFSVIGAKSMKGNAIDNKVTISGGTAESAVYGGYAMKGNATGNEVTVTGGQINDNVTAGFALEGSATGNIVNVSGGAINDNVCAGFALAGSATGNIVNVTGGAINEVEDAESGKKIGGCVYGARAKGKGSVTGNTVNVSGGTIAALAYGGDSIDGDATGNTVNITAGTFGSALGGCSVNGEASGNTVNISGGETKYGACGGESSTATAKNNTVNITGGTFNSIADVKGGHSIEGDAIENVVNISGGTVNGTVFGGNSADGKANDNTVNISGGTIGGVVYGGRASKTEVSGNTVNVTGGTLKKGVVGAFAMNAAVTGNTVNISGGTVEGDVFGGRTTKCDVTGNTINFSGGVIDGTIYGGSKFATNYEPDVVTGNTLNVKALDLKAGDVKNLENINFYVPETAVNGSKMLTLTAPGDTDISAVKIGGSAAIAGNGQLAVGDKIVLLQKESGNLNTTVDGVEMTYGKLAAAEGVSVSYELEVEKQDAQTLIATLKAPEGGAKLADQTKSLVETQMAGMALLNGGMDMLAGEGIANAIAAAADASGVAAGAGADGAGSSAGEVSDGAASDGAGSDGVSGKGAVGADAGREFAMFGMLGASNMKYKTGSHVDLDGWNIGLGFAKTVENNAGKLTFGPVISYGKGSYDSYLDEGIHGEGDSSYFGIGVFAHQVNKDGLYYEGSISGGRVSNDYSSNDLKIAGAKVHEQYDTDSTFVAAHLGLGKKIEVSDKAKLDVYGKYFYAHQGGDNPKLATGETYHFDAVDSNRIRVGARYEVELGRGAAGENDVNVVANANGANDNNGKANAGAGSVANGDNGKAKAGAGAVNTLYVGTAYEYEFSGDARATYKGMETASPSLKGSSGMLELGWKVKPNATSPLTIDLSANGWCGKKEGYGLKANLLWNF